MKNLIIEATDFTPEINFDYEKNKLLIKGESYPESVSNFYGKVFESLKVYFSDLKNSLVNVDIKLIYFNSSSAKVLMNFFTLLEDSIQNGNSIVINWYYESEDDILLEFGEDFKEDFPKLTFNLVEIEE